MNCWEFKKCGREPGGARVAELGVCPAGTDSRLNPVHGGRNGGRSCWVVAGTLCGGEVQGTFAAKFRNCKRCEFYGLVKKEEYPDFRLAATLRTPLDPLQHPAVHDEADGFNEPGAVAERVDEPGAMVRTTTMASRLRTVYRSGATPYHAGGPESGVGSDPFLAACRRPGHPVADPPGLAGRLVRRYRARTAPRGDERLGRRGPAGTPWLVPLEARGPDVGHTSSDSSNTVYGFCSRSIIRAALLFEGSSSSDFAAPRRDPTPR